MQVQFTEQPENKNEIQDMLDFYQSYGINQISVNKMFVTSDKGIEYGGVDFNISYKKGNCQSYGSYIVGPNGSVLGCCGQFYFYPMLKDKVPNIFKQSLEECKKQSDDLYLNNKIFNDYCKNCSLYIIGNEEILEKKFIQNGYFAMQYPTNTRFFAIPKELSKLSDEILLFMYEKGMVKEIKNFIQEKQSE